MKTMNLDSDGRTRPTGRGISMMRRGATYLEYALLAALVGIVGAVGVKVYGGKIKNFFIALGQQTESVTPKNK